MQHGLVWNSSFSVGHPILEKQHQKLLELCATVTEYLAASGEDSNDQAHSIVNELMTYAQEHFATEKALLEDCAYPALAEQQAKHSQYLRELSKHLFLTMDGQARPGRAQTVRHRLVAPPYP